MSIQKDLDELNMINIEVRRLQESLRTFRKQKQVIEERVIQFLKEQETHGVRYNDQAVLLESKAIRNKKRKNDKLNDLTSVLRKHGIQKNDTLLNDILEAQRGHATDNHVLKMVRRS
jgi:hypothetical protein